MNSVYQTATNSPKTVVVSQLLRSFVAIEGISPRLHSCGGNPCLLLSLEAPPLAAPAADSGSTQCQSWPLAYDVDETRISVRCYSASGQLIQCCGHGLLAAAHSWQRRLQCDAVNLSMNGSVVPSWREGNVTWLRFASLQLQSLTVPSWVWRVFSGPQQPDFAAVSAESRGYLVLQWPDGFDLMQLDPPTAALAGWTERALICTAARPDWGEGTIQLRYFAPQYGVEEDAATGSAMRVLAQYWSGRFSQLTAYQCSSTGGLLLSRHTAEHVEVGGRCVTTTEGTHD